MKFKGKVVLFILMVVLAMAGGAMAQGKAALWDGSQWTQVPYDAKVGYVAGVGNMADFDVAAGKGKYGVASRAFSSELKTKTVGQVVGEVDKYYQENPNKLSTTVLEVIAIRCAAAICPPEMKAGAKRP
ncbi:MAG: hypothetical protein M1438_19440 [Deltaproteobacteria bacterium]|nr:hypothetical protein [Deltaproteobacteria bacterium]